MANTPIGLGPNTPISGLSQSADVKAGDDLRFRSPDNKGSSVAELLRGKLSQFRAGTAAPANLAVNFQPLANPSAATLGIMGRLQNGI
ncbi:hypothetical protein [Yoonia sp. BS5-3]|uniref:Uncharacterized protein n=1 Tax=Yoonia phaeophyticola TaxID=3137369 RepID=A0ABZ2V3V7_9RHOB